MKTKKNLLDIAKKTQPSMEWKYLIVKGIKEGYNSYYKNI
jgi:hypothetical protein